MTSGSAFSVNYGLSNDSYVDPVTDYHTATGDAKSEETSEDDKLDSEGGGVLDKAQEDDDKIPTSS